MDNQVFEIESLAKKAGHYIQTSVELQKLKAIEKVANGAGEIFSKLILIPLVILFFLSMNLGAALLTGELLGRMSYGFFILAGFYGLLATVLYFFGNKWVRNAIVKYASKIELPWKNQKHQES